ncbi:MAG TPA: GspE/PulE family protein [Armatimonadota bacterium]|jgi:type IV pilus assembly protein PilB
MLNKARQLSVEVTHDDMRRITVEDRDLRADIDMGVATTVNAIIAAAIRYGASDIHFEPMEDELRVRIRVDGSLCQLVSLDKLAEPQVMSRLKVMCKMKLDDQRLPQDGRITVTYKDEPYSHMYNIRVSVIPKHLINQPSEKAVLRLLRSTVGVDINKLGFSEPIKAQLESVMEQPQGIFLLTGPTGSGKSTTLNGMLTRLNKMDVNILTIEDPIEYHIPGITQVQTYEAIGLTFGSALRAFLRQDPDIIMVGEMRDAETVQIAVRAALTGHLVLSTLHTNDAPSAIPRLVDLGAEPYLIASSLMGVMAQRLVKCLCPQCKEAYQAQASELACLGYNPENPDAPVTLYRPKGCTGCLHTGYKGRRGIFELLMVNKEIRELIRLGRSVSVEEVRRVARENGMQELRDEGLALVLNGTTTIDQIKRVVYTVDW